MLTVQHLFRPEGIVSDAKGQVPLQASAEFVRTYNAQAHEIVDAITAAVTRAQAGLNWLRAEPPDLEEVRQMLNFIVSDSHRAAEIVIRVQGSLRRCPQRMQLFNPRAGGRTDVAFWHVCDMPGRSDDVRCSG